MIMVLWAIFKYLGRVMILPNFGVQVVIVGNMYTKTGLGICNCCNLP